MPRKSSASLSVAPLNPQQRRLKPPADLRPEIAAIWHQLVDSLPGDRFHNSDAPLLALYCRALHQAAEAYRNIEETVASDGDSLNPWLRVADSFVKQAATLATKLRLCPQSRMDRKVAGPAARAPGFIPPWEPKPATEPTAKETADRESGG